MTTSPSSNLSPAKQGLGLLASLAISYVTAAVGSIASIQEATFYGQLVQPTWAPPAWLFGPAWTLLFTLMAVSAWLVWRKHGFAGASTAFKVYGAQLVANALWTWLFFAWHRAALAFAEILVLWLLIAATITLFWRLHKLAALLLVPYLMWVSFAACLNFALWRLNPAVFG